MRIFFKYVFFVLTLDKVNHMKQCVIPCLEGLLPVALESVVMDMLWTFLMWHALAKLHTHTETTVTILDVMHQKRLAQFDIRNIKLKNRKPQKKNYLRPKRDSNLRLQDLRYNDHKSSRPATT